MNKIERLFIIQIFVAFLLLTSIPNAVGLGDAPTFDVKVGEPKKIRFTFSNYAEEDHRYIYAIVISDERDFVEQVSWVEGIINAGEQFSPEQSWIPEKPSRYTVKIYVWECLDCRFPPVPNLTMIVNVRA